MLSLSGFGSSDRIGPTIATMTILQPSTLVESLS
jgi:hypothetical protein